MIFFGLLAVAAILLFASFVWFYEDGFGPFLVIACSIVGIGIYCAATSESGPTKVEWSESVSNVHAYSNPNGGAVLVFTDSHGKTRGMDEGGDGVTLVPGSNSSKLVEYCTRNPEMLVPWDNARCEYKLYAENVN
jgi:hypothetical protein